MNTFNHSIEKLFAAQACKITEKTKQKKLIFVCRTKQTLVEQLK